jgi:hypothetical protein
MQIHNFFTSRTFQIVTWVVAGLIVLSFVFHAGVRVGFNKASHSFERRGNPSFAPMGGRSREASPFMERGELGETHGAFGAISGIVGDVYTITDRNNEQRAVLISDSAPVMKGGERVSRTTLVVGNVIAVIGDTNDAGQVVARIIRIMPKQMGGEGFKDAPLLKNNPA